MRAREVRYTGSEVIQESHVLNRMDGLQGSGKTERERVCVYFPHSTIRGSGDCKLIVDRVYKWSKTGAARSENEKGETLL